MRSTKIVSSEFLLLPSNLVTDKIRGVTVARKKLDMVNANLQHVEDSIRHYLSQIDQIQNVARLSAEVEMSWPNLGQLQREYIMPSLPGEEGEDEDNSASQSGPHDNANGSDWHAKVTNGRSNLKRKTTLSTALPSLFSFGMKPWPRRSSLDPAGTSRVDPIRRVELTVDHVKSQEVDMTVRRGRTLRDMQSMIGRIDALIRQKDAVRNWTKTALEQNRSLQHAVDSLHRQIRGDSRARMGRLKDRIYDTTIRRLFSPLFRGFFGIIYLGRWTWSLRSAVTRREAVRGLRGAPWGVWGFGTVVLGVALLFYYIGG